MKILLFGNILSYFTDLQNFATLSPLGELLGFETQSFSRLASNK